MLFLGSVCPPHLPFSSVVCLSVWLFFSFSCLRSSSLSALCDFLFLFFFSLPAVLCAYVVGGCSCGVVMLCLRCPCLLSLLVASSPKRCLRTCKACCSLSAVLSSCFLSGYGSWLHACLPVCPCVHALACVATAGVGPLFLFR